MHKENARLWNEFLSGDFDAYRKIYNDNVDALFHFGMQFTSKRELVKDCIQDVFIALFNKSTELGSDCRFRPYLFSSLRNAIFNCLRKNANFETYSENILPEPVRDSSPEDVFIVCEEETIVRKKVDSILVPLTSRQRDALFYRFIEGLSIDQIAFIMQMEKQSVQNLIQRAIKKSRR